MKIIRERKIRGKWGEQREERRGSPPASLLGRVTHGASIELPSPGPLPSQSVLSGIPLALGVKTCPETLEKDTQKESFFSDFH